MPAPLAITFVRAVGSAATLVGRYGSRTGNETGLSLELTLDLNAFQMRKVKRKLAQVKRDVGSAYPAHVNLGIRLVRWVSENFESEGKKVGGWKPFKYGGRVLSRKQAGQNFAAIKSKGRWIDPSANLLRDTNHLHASFLPFRATNDSVTIGSDVPYSIFHELGVPQRNVPQRRMLPRPTDEEVLNLIFNVYEDYLDHVAKK